jgi:hypothetical protein
MPAPTLLLSLIACGLLLIGLGMVIVWIRSAGGIGPLCDRLLRRDEILSAIVLIASGVLTVSWIARGDPSLGEAQAHIARGWLWHDYLRAGTFPRWTDLWYGGFPIDQSDPPLPYPCRPDRILPLPPLHGGEGDRLVLSDHRGDRVRAPSVRESTVTGGRSGRILYALAPTFTPHGSGKGARPASFPRDSAMGLLATERIATGRGGAFWRLPWPSWAEVSFSRISGRRDSRS